MNETTTLTPEEALWHALAVNIDLHLRNGGQTLDQNVSDLRDGILTSLRRQGFDLVRSS